MGNPEQSSGDFGPSPELKLEGNDWVLPSDPAVLNRIRSELERRLRGAGWSGDELEHALVGAEEAITNAIERGNLEVPSKSSFQDEPDAYSRAIKQAMASELGPRQVQVTVDIIPEHIELVVGDEGRGFDVNSLPDPTSEEEITKFKQGGRGVFLMRSTYDKVVFNETGNVVALRKARQVKT